MIPRVDLVVLGVVSLLAANASIGDRIVPAPDVFATLHAIAGTALLVAVAARSLAPAAVGMAFGLFVGRALGIAYAIVADVSPIPAATLVLAIAQWCALAYFTRPAHVTGVHVLARHVVP